MTNKLSEELYARMRDTLPGDLTLPPPIFTEMQAEFIAFDEAAKTIRVRFPVQARYGNPLRIMQGGMIAAAIDSTVGPLSYLVAPPSVTTQMNLSYIRPVAPELPYIEVAGRITEQTRRYLFMEGRAYSPDERLLVLAHVTAQVIEKS